MAKSTCSVEGCERFVVGRGLCASHYRRAKLDGGELPPTKWFQPKRPCSASNCGRPAGKVSGLCKMHLERWYRTGKLETTRTYRVGGGPRLAENGYVYLFRPDHPLAMVDGYVAEHRMVVHDAGIEVPDGCTVHHINHDKADNRLENLRVMSSSEHAIHHIEERGTITNQFGTWPVTDLASGRRICTTCGTEKPFAEFTSKHGRPVHECKACARSRRRSHRARPVKEATDA